MLVLLPLLSVPESKTGTESSVGGSGEPVEVFSF